MQQQNSSGRIEDYLPSEQGCTIYLFHGVIEKHRHPVRNYNRKHIERSYFGELLDAFARSSVALTMDDLVEHHRSKKPLPPRSFVITFDDGFANNLTIAAPMLEERKLPAIFYITTGWIDNDGLSWIDAIELAIEATPDVSLQLSWSKAPLTAKTAEEKIELLTQIRQVVKSTPAIDRSKLTKEIFSQCGMDPVLASKDDLDKKLSWEQVRELQANPLFTVGGHSHTHAILSFLSPPELTHELRICTELLQKNIPGWKPLHFAYPDGGEQHYSPAVIQALKQLGYICSPTAISGTVQAADDLFHLRRVMVV